MVAQLERYVPWSRFSLRSLDGRVAVPTRPFLPGRPYTPVPTRFYDRRTSASVSPFVVDGGRRSGGGFAFLREAFTAEDGAALGGAEGDGGLFAALGADGAGFYTREMVAIAR
jgi:hypothetical protein